MDSRTTDSSISAPLSPLGPNVGMQQTRVVQTLDSGSLTESSMQSTDSRDSSMLSIDDLSSSRGPSNVGSRFRRSKPNSKSSSNSDFTMRDSNLSRMSSRGSVFRDTFFGQRRQNDPLLLSTNEEFELNVIDESGGLDEHIGDILKPEVEFGMWSTTGYIVTALGVFTFVVTFSLTMSFQTLDGYNIDSGLVFGSFQTLVLCVIVYITYNGVQSFQAHPNPLILYKCVIDILLSLRFLLDPVFLHYGFYVAGDQKSCKYVSAITQFLLLASDSWYFALIVDLYKSLTNPFTSVKGDRRTYKLAIYTLSGLSGVLTAVIPGAHGLSDGNYCWHYRGNPHERHFFKLNVSTWLFFYDFMIVFYLAGIAVLIFGFKRLQSGLRDTLQTRRDMLRNGAMSITSYTVYWTIVFAWYAGTFNSHSTHGKMDVAPTKVFRTFTYILAGRGLVDYFVWFMLNRPSLMKQYWLKFSAESADKKFSAQLNTALQRELIYFTIEGMTRAIQVADEELLIERNQSPTQELVFDEHTDIDGSNLGHTPDKDGNHNEHVVNIPQEASNSGIDDVTRSKPRKNTQTDGEKFTIDVPHSSSVNDPELSALEETTSGSHAHIRFTPYRAAVFAELRSAYGIDTQDFIKSFETTTKPNISEGASGAFMFFSGDRKFIVKSMAEAECRFLCQIAEEYVEHLITNPCSLITKFFGCFKITLYEKKFYFVVMENLFNVEDDGMQIHHRFDIKGSWVNRSYKKPRRGAKVKCRHCSMQFKYGAKKSLLACPNVVGLHEPNVVLKDNDLRTRMRIGTEEGKELYEQLRDDSEFLRDLGIMDYSLLLGVMDIEFIVDHEKPRRRSTGTTVKTSSNETFVSVASSASDRDSVIPAGYSRNHQNSKDSGDFGSGDHGMQSLSSLVAEGTDTSSSNFPKRTMRKSKRVFGPGYYYIGIIDILQTWTLKKKLERFWKVNIQRCDPEGLSAINPIEYQKRFEAKLREIIYIPKEYHRIKDRAHRKTRSDAGIKLFSAAPGSAPFVNDQSGQGNARDRVESDDISLSTNTTDEDDLEQSNRNPRPILLQFNQRLVGSTRSNVTNTSLGE